MPPIATKCNRSVSATDRQTSPLSTSAPGGALPPDLSFRATSLSLVTPFQRVSRSLMLLMCENVVSQLSGVGSLFKITKIRNSALERVRIEKRRQQASLHAARETMRQNASRKTHPATRSPFSRGIGALSRLGSASVKW